MNHINSHADLELQQKRNRRSKAISYVYSLVNIVIGFFCLWKFAEAMRYVIGFSENIYWLSKAWWQQVAFIGVALVFMIVVLVSQHLYEQEMIRHERKIPRSFVAITACELLFYAACKVAIAFYFVG